MSSFVTLGERGALKGADEVGLKCVKKPYGPLRGAACSIFFFGD